MSVILLGSVHSPGKSELNFIKLVHRRNSIHHLALLLVRGTCRNMGVHLSYKHSLIVVFYVSYDYDYSSVTHFLVQ